MGLLSTDDCKVSDFTKAVISIWFRVPKKSIDACLKAAIANPTFPPLSPLHLYAIIPFVTFGKPQVGPVIQGDNVSLGSFMDGAAGPYILYKETNTNLGNAYTDPSVIGLQLNVDLNTDTLAGLNVYGSFQTSAYATIDGTQVVDMGAPTFDSGFVNGMTVTWMDQPLPQGPQTYGFSINVNKDTFADKWHHVLVSCDLSNSVSGTSDSATFTGGITGANHMWVALDDVDYNKDSLTTWTESGDNNAVCSNAVSTAAGAPEPPTSLPLPFSVPVDANLHNMINGVPSGMPTTSTPLTCTVSAEPVPVNGHSFGLPSTTDQTDQIYEVDLAEFQMFTGVTLDTSVESNRRAFIDANLQPVVSIISRLPYDPTDPLAAPISMPPSQPIALLGQSPDIAFVSSSNNWQRGFNLGSSGGGGFGPTGTINPFVPDPKVGS